MAIKVNFADAFLQSYGPGAQQGAHQWQQMQRQKQQEEQFQLERQDALAQFAQKQALDERQFASVDEYRKGQLAQDQAKVDAEQADVQTAAKGMQSLATGEVPDPRKRIADIAGMFKSEGPQREFIGRETKALGEREKKDAAGKLSLRIREAKARPEIAGDAVLGGQLELAEQIAMDPDADPIQLLKEVDSIYEQAGARRGEQENQADYQSMFGADVQQQQGIADAMKQAGDLEGSQAIYDRIMDARSKFGPAWVEPGKAGDAYKTASESLYPWRKGGSTSKKEKEPYSMAEALKLMQGSINEADAVRATKALKAQARKAGKSEEEIDDIEGPTVLELQREAARALMSEMNAAPPMQQPGARQPSQAQMRTQPGGMAQPMNGQQQAQAPAQAAPVQAPALPPAAFDKRKPEEQQGFIQEIEADLRDGGGTNLEAIYQKYGVVPGSIPPAVKARLKRAASGGR